MGGETLPLILSSYYHKPHSSAFISSEARAPYVSLLLSQRQVRQWHHQRPCVLYKTGSRGFSTGRSSQARSRSCIKTGQVETSQRWGFWCLVWWVFPISQLTVYPLLYSDGWRERRSIRKEEKRHGIKLRERRWRLTLRKRTGSHLGRATLY